MRQIAEKVRRWLRYRLGPSDLELRLQELKGELDLNFQEIRQGMAGLSADHIQTLSALGLLIADQKAMLQMMKEGEHQRNPLIALEARLNELQGIIEKQSTDTRSAIGLLVADQEARLDNAGNVAAGEGQTKRASKTAALKGDHV